MFNNAPTAPYYAVIFTSVMADETSGYDAMAEKMVSLAQQQPGFLGMDSARSDLGITVSYWRDLDSIRAWKSNPQHQVAQSKGQAQWYQGYTVRIAKVERDYSMEGEEE
ncbi:antibiotic biosynthesis monooxygenase [Aestuariibacter halophilus]|uniref:Antibiotic biosynthesis monooxygenase n=1 Tax=Fluctibacter halophilus TaxID=226011 RepID=A0ABS8G5G5_9ALTE|nr:antibiotic biosynthesis monooxygenase [Aestuariibacter halophilus]MCC2615728.1 antibiotic biosynthesis monooxygenase [Aestuariibacter halophilus]